MVTKRSLEREIEHFRELIRRRYIEMEGDLLSAERNAIAEDIQLYGRELAKLTAKLASITSSAK